MAETYISWKREDGILVGYALHPSLGAQAIVSIETKKLRSGKLMVYLFRRNEAKEICISVRHAKAKADELARLSNFLPIPQRRMS